MEKIITISFSHVKRANSYNALSRLLDGLYALLAIIVFAYCRDQIGKGNNVLPMLDRAGHFVCIEQDALCHALMREWLDRVEEGESH